MTTLLLAADKSGGTLQAAPPWLLAVGGLVAVILGVVLLVVASKMDEGSIPHYTLMGVSWLLMLIGICGLGVGFFGPWFLE